MVYCSAVASVATPCAKQSELCKVSTLHFLSLLLPDCFISAVYNALLVLVKFCQAGDVPVGHVVRADSRWTLQAFNSRFMLVQ